MQLHFHEERQFFEQVGMSWPSICELLLPLHICQPAAQVRDVLYIVGSPLAHLYKKKMGGC